MRSMLCAIAGLILMLSCLSAPPPQEPIYDPLSQGLLSYSFVEKKSAPLLANSNLKMIIFGPKGGVYALPFSLKSGKRSYPLAPGDYRISCYEVRVSQMVIYDFDSDIVEMDLPEGLCREFTIVAGRETWLGTYTARYENRTVDRFPRMSFEP